ncbi:hypothetical protein [Amycolatopsis sp. NPDC051102]|uniref:hypothetical protein n=1 Tax=Amycolatopsis sp. NPDC051102 TaxID=3155163 RepID=UPI003412A2B3
MTWWAAVLGFVGALAGSWGGQLIASRREDRRWDRERDREEVRWQRERSRLDDQRRHEFQLDWRERKLAEFGDFLGGLDQALSAAMHAHRTELEKVGLAYVRGPKEPARDEIVEGLRAASARMSAALAVIQVIADSAVVKLCKTLSVEVFSLSLMIFYWDGDDTADVQERIGKDSGKRGELLAEMRAGLGVDADVSPAPAGPGHATRAAGGGARA